MLSGCCTKEPTKKGTQGGDNNENENGGMYTWADYLVGYIDGVLQHLLKQGEGGLHLTIHCSIMETSELVVKCLWNCWAANGKFPMGTRAGWEPMEAVGRLRGRSPVSSWDLPVKLQGSCWDGCWVTRKLLEAPGKLPVGSWRTHGQLLGASW